MRFSRLVSGPALTVPIAVSGSAGNATQAQADHNLPASFSLTIPANATNVETNIVATSDNTAEGWEGVALSPNLLQSTVSLDPHPPYFAFVGDNVADPGLLPGGDADADGLSDRWEIDHNLDPLDPNDAQLDPDKDGLTNADEERANTDPQDDDSDNDGQKDFEQRYRPEPGPDYLAIRLRTLDTGKVNNGANCAVCHTTRLKTGDYRTAAPLHNQPVEQTFNFLKGTSYPIWLQEISRNHLPTTNTGSTPTTTAQYNAEILPATDALPAAFVVQDPNNKLGTNQPWTNFPSDPTVAVGTLIVPKIEVMWADVPNSTAFDTNVNVGGGYCFYPDQHSPTDTVDRRNLILRVKTIPPLPGQQVRLRSLDVDDPLPWDQDDKAYSIDPNDRTTGFQGNDNRDATPTTPREGLLLETVLTLDNQGEAGTDFFVTLKPGDNFRVAAVLDTPGASNHLNALQVDNITAPLYVTPDQDEVEGFVGGLSPMLTVWRKLHLEFDSMTAPPPSGPEALHEPVVVFRVTPNRPVSGHSQVTLIWTNGFEGYNQYERGKLEVSGVDIFRTLNSWTRVASGFNRTYTDVEIDAVLGTNTAGLSGKLYDDDNQYLANDPLYPSSLGLQLPPLPAFNQINPFLQAAQPKFDAAYITLVDANALGWNSQSNIVFRRYVAPYLTAGTILDNGNLQLKGTDRADFWAFSVVFGFQASTVISPAGVVVEAALFDDGDPDIESPLFGSTRENPVTGTPVGYSAIFLEDIRDYEFGRRKAVGEPDIPRGKFADSSWAPLLAQQYRERVYAVIAHEVGHAPGRQLEGSDHEEDGIMIKGAPQSMANDKFRPSTIARFRAAESWTRK